MLCGVWCVFERCVSTFFHGGNGGSFIHLSLPWTTHGWGWCVVGVVVDNIYIVWSIYYISGIYLFCVSTSYYGYYYIVVNYIYIIILTVFLHCVFFCYIFFFTFFRCECCCMLGGWCCVWGVSSWNFFLFVCMRNWTRVQSCESCVCSVIQCFCYFCCQTHNFVWLRTCQTCADFSQTCADFCQTCLDFYQTCADFCHFSLNFCHSCVKFHDFLGFFRCECCCISWSIM